MTRVSGIWLSALAAITRNYPFYSGCGTLANSLLMEMLAPSSSELVWARSMAGDVRISLDDYVGRAIYFFGDLDPKITWTLRRLLQPGDSVLDIGANLGLITLWMSKLVGANGVVHAFEPNPTLCLLMEATLERNRVSNVQLHTVALGSVNDQMTLYVPTGKLGAGSLLKNSAPNVFTHTVPVATLDSMNLCHYQSRISLVKIDVEGFELDVLTGAKTFFQNFKPEIVLFESNEDSKLEGPTPVMRLLYDYGYQFLMIPKCLVRMGTRVFDMNRPFRVHGNDIVAARKGTAFNRACKLLNAR